MAETKVQEQGPPESTDGWPKDGQSYSSKDLPPEGRTVKLRREELVAHKEMRHLGDIEIRTETEHVPGRLQVEALREQVEVEHVPVGRVVSEREEPHQEGDELIVPIYEEQLVVSKRLILREELRIHRQRSTDVQVFEDTLRRDHVVVEDPQSTGLLRERYPTENESEGPREGFFESFKRKMMQP